MSKVSVKLKGIFQFKIFEFLIYLHEINFSSRMSLVDSCELVNAILMPRHRCNGRSKCWIYHGMFHSDPCKGVRKYAQVDYECV